MLQLVNAHSSYINHNLSTLKGGAHVRLTCTFCYGRKKSKLDKAQYRWKPTCRNYTPTKRLLLMSESWLLRSNLVRTAEGCSIFKNPIYFSSMICLDIEVPKVGKTVRKVTLIRPLDRKDRSTTKTAFLQSQGTTGPVSVRNVRYNITFFQHEIRKYNYSRSSIRTFIKLPVNRY